MAREKYITRSVTTTFADVTAVNLVESTVISETLAVHGLTDNASAKDVEKRFHEVYDGDQYRIVKLDNVRHEEVLYKIREVDFLIYATRVDNRSDNI